MKRPPFIIGVVNRLEAAEITSMSMSLPGVAQGDLPGTNDLPNAQPGLLVMTFKRLNGSGGITSLP